MPASGSMLSITCYNFGSESKDDSWFRVQMFITNASEKRTAAIKLQANLFDSFGTLVQSWIVTEPAHLKKGDADLGGFAVKRYDSAIQSVERVDLYVLAIKYEDGSTWFNPEPQPIVGPTPGPTAELQHYNFSGS